jgi:hypothetical protein
MVLQHEFGTFNPSDRFCFCQRLYCQSSNRFAPQHLYCRQQEYDALITIQHSVSEEHGILMAHQKSINFRTWCHRNIAEILISQVKAERESNHYNRPWRPVDL